MAAYDLTSKISGYLDRHLIFPMLEFLTEYKVLLELLCRISDDCSSVYSLGI